MSWILLLLLVSCSFCVKQFLSVISSETRRSCVLLQYYKHRSTNRDAWIRAELSGAYITRRKIIG